jgi:hypothetical protein
LAQPLCRPHHFRFRLCRGKTIDYPIDGLPWGAGDTLEYITCRQTHVRPTAQMIAERLRAIAVQQALAP